MRTATAARKQRLWKAMGRRLAVVAVASLAACAKSSTEPDPGSTGPTKGSLTITVAGLPSGLDASVTVTGPGSFSQSVTGTKTFNDLTPGTYTIAAANVSGPKGATYAPGQTSQTKSVAAGATASATLTYAEQLASLTLTLSGLPSGVDGDVEVTGGPDDAFVPVTSTTTLADLRTGQYTVSAKSVTNSSDVYDPDPESQTVTLTANQAANAEVTYQLRPVAQATIDLTVTGLPGGVDATVLILWQGNQVYQASGSESIPLDPGDYTVNAEAVTAGAFEYLPDPATQDVTLPEGGSVPVTVTYVPQVGSLDIAISGLPGGVDADVTVTGPGSFQQAVTGSSTLSDLAPGAYTVMASSVDDGGATYNATPTTQDVTVEVGMTATASVAYAVFSLATPVHTIGVGPGYSCALDSGGSLSCWGLNDQGRFGNDSVNADPRTTPVPAASGMTFAKISLGGQHACGLTVSAEAYCWGDNAFGQLGDGTNDDRLTPVAVSGGYTFSQIDAGGRMTCGLVATGQAYCWGQNSLGSLGDGSTDDKSLPSLVTGGHTFVDLAVYGLHACGLDDAGQLYCWGTNTEGQLGLGFASAATFATPIPQAVVGDHLFARVAKTGGELVRGTCALEADGAAWCWGSNITGELGDLSLGAQWPTPVPIPGGHAFVDTWVGGGYNCGIDPSGQNYCWGGSTNGQFGNGVMTTYSTTPVATSGGITFVGLSMEGGHACGVDAMGQVYCWGSNYRGEIGDGTTQDRYVPTPVVF